MSSSTYSTQLHPDPALRGVVLLSGITLYGVGAWLLMTSPLPFVARLLGCAAWLFLCGRELVSLRRDYARCRRLRLAADGGLLLLGRHGNWRPAVLLPGSIVLRRLAWIRFKTPEGRCCAELLSGDCRDSHDWRRLRVIWRHIGATP